MHSAHSSYSTRLKVGIFSALGLCMIGGFSIFINQKPFWWKECQFVRVNVEDATGIKSKSPVKSLGIEIGYLRSVTLSEKHVSLGICITAPVEILPSTRAYVRGEGFLGDKFIELKPVKYTGPVPKVAEEKVILDQLLQFFNFFLPQSALAADLPMTSQRSVTEDSKGRPTSSSFTDEEVQEGIPSSVPHSSPRSTSPAMRKSNVIPVKDEGQDIQKLVGKVDELVLQMSGLTENLRKGINPEDIRAAMKQLNKTLENASKTLAPEGGLNQTAQRTLAKLEDSIEQLRDMLTRINQGKGSLGMLVNDPAYADEIRDTIRNMNRFFSRAAGIRFVVDLGGANLTGAHGGRGWLNIGVWPTTNRYYLLGISSDSRGKISNTMTTTTVGGTSQKVSQQTIEQNTILFTGMLGKIFFNRIDLSAGALYGDGTVSLALRLGPKEAEQRIQLRTDVYVRNSASSVDARFTAMVEPFKHVYLRAGMESTRRSPLNDQMIYFYGAGISFDDEDIKVLFVFR